MNRFKLIFLLSLAMISCSKEDEFLLGEVQFTVIYEGSSSLITEADTWIIKNEYAWEVFKSNSFPSIELVHNIDFNTQIILAVSQGEKPTGGYSIAISGIFEFDDYLEVEVQEFSPAPGQEVTLALTQPFQIVVIEKTEKSILFN